MKDTIRTHITEMTEREATKRMVQFIDFHKEKQDKARADMLENSFTLENIK